MMTQKKILVPTDFSGCSIKALKWAMKLAKIINARLIIMNACQRPAAYTDPHTISYSKNLVKQAESNAMAAFDRLKEELTQLEEVEHEFVVKHSFPQDIIISMALKDHYELIVMGTTGVSGLAGRLLGSNTYAVIKHVKCPVLAIPEESGEHISFHKITLTGDYRKTASKETFSLLIDLARKENSQIHILHVTNTSLIKPDETEQARKFDRYFKNLRHDFHYQFDEHIDKGINDFLAENHMDLLVMVAKNHNLLERISHASVTKKMTFYSKTPLLVLHEK